MRPSEIRLSMCGPGQDSYILFGSISHLGSGVTKERQGGTQHFEGAILRSKCYILVTKFRMPPAASQL